MRDDVGTSSCLARPFVGLSGEKRSQEASNQERKERKEKGRRSSDCFYQLLSSHFNLPFKGKHHFMMDDDCPWYFFPFPLSRRQEVGSRGTASLHHRAPLFVLKFSYVKYFLPLYLTPEQQRFSDLLGSYRIV